MPAGGYPVQVFNPNGQWGNTSRGFLYLGGSTSVEVLTAVESLGAATAEPSANATAATAPTEGTFRRYLAEGVETDQMRTQLAIANPAGVRCAGDADVRDEHRCADAAGGGRPGTLASDGGPEHRAGARRRLVLDAPRVGPGAGARSPHLASTRRVRRPASRRPSTSRRRRGTSPRARRSTRRSSSTCVQNPGDAEAQVRVRYLLPNGAGAGRAHLQPSRPAAARRSGSIARVRPWPATDVAAEITSVDGTPIVVERSLYLRQAGSAAPRGGDSSVGVTAPATRWFVEGATGQFKTRLLLANPGAEAAAVRATYQRADGRSLTRSYTLAPNSRQTVDVATVHPSLANTTLGITVEASAPIVVERTKWWGANGTSRRGGQRCRDDRGRGAVAPRRGRDGRRPCGADRRRRSSTRARRRSEGHAALRGRPGSDGDLPGRRRRAALGADGRRLPVGGGPPFSVLVEGADPSASLIVDRAIFWRRRR